MVKKNEVPPAAKMPEKPKPAKEGAENDVNAVEERFRVERLLMEKDWERERDRLKMTISALEDKVKDQGDRIRTLERDLRELMSESQMAAAKVIEGIAGILHGASPTKEQVESLQKKGHHDKKD